MVSKKKLTRNEHISQVDLIVQKRRLSVFLAAAVSEVKSPHLCLTSSRCVSREIIEFKLNMSYQSAQLMEYWSVSCEGAGLTNLPSLQTLIPRHTYRDRVTLQIGQAHCLLFV